MQFKAKRGIIRSLTNEADTDVGHIVDDDQHLALTGGKAGMFFTVRHCAAPGKGIVCLYSFVVELRPGPPSLMSPEPGAVPNGQYNLSWRRSKVRQRRTLLRTIKRLSWV